MAVKMGRAKRAWGALREQGGVLRDHRGGNMTGSATGWASLGSYLDTLCGNDDELSEDLLKAMEEAARQAKLLQEMNAIPTTNPKCYSKPELNLKVGCRVEWKMTARNGDEEDCTDLQ